LGKPLWNVLHAATHRHAPASSHVLTFWMCAECMVNVL
jgi:hypothetical protein